MSKTTLRLEENCCADWPVQIEKVNGPIVLQSLRAGRDLYDGIPFRHVVLKGCVTATERRIHRPTMREIRFKSDYWQSLAPLSFRLRGLYTVLLCSCDHTGVLVWNSAKIAEDAGGKGFGLADIVGLGNRVMWLDAEFEEGSRLLVVDYLAMQNKTLSRKCYGQNPAWKQIASHWPRGLVEEWTEMGIADRLPPIKGEHQPKPAVDVARQISEWLKSGLAPEKLQKAISDAQKEVI